MKEQIENVKVKDLESELEETRKVLKCTTEEIWLLKEKSRVEEETSKKKDNQISKLSISLTDIEEYKRKESDQEDGALLQMKTMLKDCWKKLESSKVEVNQLNEMIIRGDAELTGKEIEIAEMKCMIEKDNEDKKVGINFQFFL